MKRSAYVRLVVLGSALSAGGCETVTEELRQQSYASREECLQDWQDPRNCTPVRSSNFGASGGNWFGPRYYWDREAGHPVAVAADGSARALPATQHISPSGSAHGVTSRVGTFARGGFGAIGHAFGHASGHGG